MWGRRGGGGASRSCGRGVPPSSWGGAAAARGGRARGAGRAERGAGRAGRAAGPTTLPCAPARAGRRPARPAAACSAASPRTAPASRTNTSAERPLLTNIHYISPAATSIHPTRWKYSPNTFLMTTNLFVFLLVSG